MGIYYIREVRQIELENPLSKQMETQRDCFTCMFRIDKGPLDWMYKFGVICI